MYGCNFFFAPRRFSSFPDKVPYLLPLFFSLFLCSFAPCVVIFAFICVPHDLGCVVETYWLHIGRRSSDASRRPSRSSPLMRATYHLTAMTILTNLFIHPTSCIYPALTYFYYHYRSSFVVLLSPLHRSILRACTWLPRSEIFS